ncbi:MAG: prolipoprotein diacylglyceryl transferase [Anaerolineae bacterium]|nr:prolipoprotein diacylglyceryl transferase [Anaerolineae bacterium]
MITISIDPVIFSIGHLMIRWYGLIVATAVIVGVWLAAREAERKGFKKEDIYDAAMWIVPGGLLGARLFHVLDHWSHEYAANPVRALYLWEGGLAIWGGVIGGLIAGIILARQRRWRLPRLLDAVAPGLVLAQAIGRVACIITGDAVGKPTSGPFGLAYTNPGAMVPQLGVYYTPTQVYEIIMNLFIFAVLWRWRDKKLPDGALFLIYLLLYSSLRFLITFWSSYEIIALGLNQAQLISLAALIIGLPWLVYLLRRHKVVRLAT